MATRDKHDELEPEQEVLDAAIVAYHVLGELLNGKRTLDIPRVARIANGTLARLREVWRNWPVFLTAIAELEPLPVGQPTEVSEGEAVNQELSTMLLVLRATCLAFLEIYGQPPRREFGFQRREE